MALLNLSVKHGTTQAEARAQMARAVDDVRGTFGVLIQGVEWSDDRNKVKLVGSGFWIEMWVDAAEVHATGDMPALGKLFGGPLASGLKAILNRSFPKQLR